MGHVPSSMFQRSAPCSHRPHCLPHLHLLKLLRYRDLKSPNLLCDVLFRVKVGYMARQPGHGRAW